ncbi:hypothetical protein [Novosphingobium sp. 9]|uniref:hypothetical protein n=1 Tax=Novosphingobium sp. 9 TaxID=2025349 RepID=UPI0021B63BCD|nr:hypothetical protein [Novosphingobium sp. 9]
MDNSNQRSTENKGGRKLSITLVGVITIIFVLAVGIMWGGADIMKRPGADPGAVQHAPAD